MPKNGLAYVTGFKVYSSARYLGGFIRDDKYKHKWQKSVYKDRGMENIHEKRKCGEISP